MKIFNVIFFIFASCSFTLQANITSLEKITADVTYLASDELKGRKNYSPEIALAADYIAKRYAEIGLQPLPGKNSFKQNFSVTTITPKSLVVELNGNTIKNNQIAIASTLKEVVWNNKNSINIHTIKKNDNLREKLTAINHVGGEHLILIHPSHKNNFLRYQHYFQQGIAKLNIEHRGAMVLVLSEITEITSLNIDVKSTFSQQTLTNVIGVLSGNDNKNEHLLFSAHYDHLGTKNNGDVIFNGADDNASGTTAVLNLAEYFAKQYNSSSTKASSENNARSLIFTAFAAEEIGGFGSQYFSSTIASKSIIAMINIEMIGKASKFGAGKVWMTGMERSNLGELLNQTLKQYNLAIYKDPYPEQSLFYRSDNATLARLGVPAHSFSSTQLDSDPHYHQPSDDINSINIPSMQKVIETIALATQSLVNGEITATRIDVKKVKAKGKIY